MTNSYHTNVIPSETMHKWIKSSTHNIPFKNINERSGALSNVNIEESKTAHLIRKIIDERGCHMSIINAFNHYIETRFSMRMENTVINLSNGYFARVSNVSIKRPMVISHGQEKGDMTPLMAKDTNGNYYGRVYADVTQYDENDEMVYEDKQILVGTIPAMVGSVLCHSYGLTDDEKMQIGTCPIEAQGYFINSANKVFKSREILRYNIVNSYKQGNNIETRITTASYSGVGSSLQLIKYNRSGDSPDRFMIYLKHFSDLKDMINVFSLFRLLGWDGDYAMEVILSYCNAPSNKINIIKQLLTNSLNYSKLVSIDEIKKKLMDSTSIKINKNIYDPVEQCKEDLFVTQPNLEFKLKTLAFMIAHSAMIVQGYVSDDDRNSWSNKQLQSATSFIETTYNGAWNTQINKIEEFFQKNHKTYDVPQTLKVKFNIEEFTKNVTEIFSTKPKSMMGKADKTPPTELFNNFTPINSLSLITKTNAATSTQDKKRESRMVHPSQNFIMCPAETPESEKIGIIKNMATTHHLAESSNAPTKRQFQKELGFKFIVDQPPYDGRRRIYPIFVNGVMYGHVDIDDIPKIMDLKKNKFLPYDSCTFFNKLQGCVEILTMGTRPTVPFLKVTKDGTLLIDEKDMWKSSIDELINEGCLEYIDARMMEYLKIAAGIEDVYDALKNNNIDRYEYSGIQANAQLACGISTSPWCNRSKSPRVIYQASMVKQSLCAFALNHQLTFSTIKRLCDAQRPICESNTCKPYGLETMPNTTQLIVAIMPRPNNNEDAVEVRRSFLEEDFLKITKYSTVKETISSKSQQFVKPKGKEEDKKYDAMMENGMPRLHEYIERKDAIVGKVVMNSGDQFSAVNKTYSAGIDDDGFVDRVFINTLANGEKCVRVKIAQHRRYEEGDKGAFRYSQKGTIGEISTDDNMPRIVGGPYHGVIPDLIFSIVSLPTRMTAAMPLEGTKGLNFICNGVKADATTFEKCDISDFRTILRTYGEKYGLEGDMLETWSDGLHYMEDSDGTVMGINKNGKFIPSRVNVAPISYQALKHHVSDKFQVRRSGPINLLTRQGISGRSRCGALRFGEMEKDAFASAGAADTLVERMRIVADNYMYLSCTCGGSVISTPQNGKILCSNNPRHGIEDKSHSLKRVPMTYIALLVQKYLAIASIKMSYIPKKDV